MVSQQAINKATLIIDRLSEIFGIDYLASDFYAGITNNVDRRLKEHNAAGYYIDCGTYDCACEVETLLANEGFNVGACPANGGTEDSKYVYVYQITASTIQDTNA